MVIRYTRVVKVRRSKGELWSANVNRNMGSQKGDGFTPVRKSGRNAVVSRRQEVVAMGQTQGKSDRQVRDYGKGKDMERIALSNSFGRLEENIQSTNLGEENDILKANKESRCIVNQIHAERSGEQGSVVVFGDGSEMGHNGPISGIKPKKVGNGKDLENKISRPQQVKTTRPTRELVFGPANGEVELSANGKRLRLEVENLGRPGDSVMTERTDRRIESGLVSPHGSASSIDQLESVTAEVQKDVDMLGSSSEKETSSLLA